MSVVPYPRPLILGHRGAPHEAPENTIAAFQAALRQGADGVELDVQRSADDVPVVIHDPDLERTTDGSGAVAGLPWELLSALRTRGEPLPSLAAAAEWAADAGAWLNVEIKAARAEEPILTTLEAAGVLERCILSSFDSHIVGVCSRLAPEVPRYLLTERWTNEALESARAVEANGICLHVDDATPGTLRLLQHEGLPVIVWTVDDAGRIAELLDDGVDGLISNRPAVAVAVARELGLRR